MKFQPTWKTISPRDFAPDANIFLVDVRTPVEFEEKHVAGSHLRPLHELAPATLEKEARGRPVCLVCRTGARAQQAAESLAANGISDLAILDGGVTAWEDAGLPLNRGKKVMSLERQVRIAAGLLVLLGVAGGFFLHPGFIALSGFVGAGLVFAGVTDWCGMGLLLARMPWNQRKPSCCRTS